MIMKKKKMITPPPPRYDDVYFEGMRWLDWLAIDEGLTICVHFQNIERGIECSAVNCPCDLYEAEKLKIKDV
jgi:hypothetical protein